ncbi:hypothetical protein KEM52_005611, partial [Ascosphaera acerosa]
MPQSSCKFLPIGAVIQEINIDGKNICLGFPTQELYEQYSMPAFGSTIGRVANRIQGGLIKDLNGKS